MSYKRFFTIFAGAFFAAFIAVNAVGAFTGPTQAPPGGSGAISVNGSNIGVSGNVTVGTAGSDYGVEILPNVSGNSVFWIDDYNNTLRFSNGNTPGNYPMTLSNGGNLVVPGTISGSYTGTLSAGNVSAGAFGSNTGGGNYTFPGNLTAQGGITTDGNVGSYYGGTPEIFVNGDNHTGGGIEVSDDGGFYDYNDGYITYNGSTGLRIAGNNGSGSSGSLYVQGNETITGNLVLGSGSVNTGTICLSGNCQSSWPSGNAGTVTSITAGAGLSGGTITNSGTISLNTGSANTWTAAQTFNGSVAANNGLNVSGSLCLNGNCQSSWPSPSSGFTHNFNSAGYDELPDGLILQWGSVYPGGGCTTATYPIAFPNAALNVQASTWQSTDRITYISSYNNSSAVICNNGTGSYADWMAIGY